MLQKLQGLQNTLDLSLQLMTTKKDLNTQNEKKLYALIPLDDFCIFNKKVDIVKERRDGYCY